MTVILIASGVGVLFTLVLLFSAFFTVKQQSIAVVERFGKFLRLAGPGLRVKIPFVDSIVARMSLRIHQLDVDVETKTKDNVFVNTKVSVQYHVLENNVVDAYYKLNKPTRQITSYVFDLIRAEIPKLTLDEVFEKKDDVAVAVKSELSDVMDDFGYGIVKALVTDIDPDPLVKKSMNEINAAERLRAASTAKGEAEKILVVKRAEAEAESKRLQGKGIADQRKAIVEGLKESVEDFQKGIAGVSAKDVMDLVLITQHFDTMKDIAGASNTNTIFTDPTPGGLDAIKQLVGQSFSAAGAEAPVVDKPNGKSNGDLRV